MTESNRPAARWQSARAGDFISGEMVPHTTAAPHLQRHRRNRPPRLMAWRVDRWLSVEAVEVRHGR